MFLLEIELVTDRLHGIEMVTTYIQNDSSRQDHLHVKGNLIQIFRTPLLQKLGLKLDRSGSVPRMCGPSGDLLANFPF